MPQIGFQSLPGAQQPASPAHAPVAAPVGMPFGAKDDPRFPSPRKLRRASAFVVDWLIHLGCGVAVFYGTGRLPGFQHDLAFFWLGLVAWFGASFVNRVVVQSIFGTTIGKAIFALRIVRPDDARKPGFGRLTRVWLLGLYTTVAAVGSLDSTMMYDDIDKSKVFLPAVRRRDLRALRSVQ